MDTNEEISQIELFCDSIIKFEHGSIYNKHLDVKFSPSC